MRRGTAQFRWAQTLLGALSESGIRFVVASPGSRSTPLALAAAQAGLSVNAVVDERSAAFLALGQARATGVPSVVLCTSGSAGAHYLPAFVEARESGVPLIAITADRPPRLQDCGASQTTRQSTMLASHAVWHVDLGLPDAANLRAVASRARRAAEQAVTAPGPVHINAPFEKPLEPDAWPAAPFSVPAGPRPRRGAVGVDTTDVREVVDAMLTARSGVVVAGPAPAHTTDAADAVRALCAATGFPLLAESTSQLRDGVRETSLGQPFARADAFDLLLRNPAFRASAATELIIQVGAAPVSKWYSEWLSSLPSGTRVVALAPHGWPDPVHRVDHLLLGPVSTSVNAILREWGFRHDDFAGRSEALDTVVAESALAWERADAAAWEAAFGWSLASEDTLTEPATVRCLAAQLPDGGFFSIGNSLPVRMLDWFVPALPEHVGVVSQRGVAGIDGGIAGAIGTALAAPNRPTTAVIGDVTFLHDVGSLQLAPNVTESALVLIVVNNDGGRIFERLPIASTAGAETVVQDLFVLPHGRSAAAMAEAFGVRAARVETVSAFSEALVSAWETMGVTVIEACVDARANDLDGGFAAIDDAITRAVTSDAPIPTLARDPKSAHGLDLD